MQKSIRSKFSALMNKDPDEAREYLHRQAFWVKPSPELQDYYCAQISRPKPPDKLAGEAIKKLRSRTASDQLHAARKLCRLACGNWTRDRGRWLSDPRIVSVILKRIDKCDQETLIELVVCLGMTGDRYKSKDVRVRDKLLQLFDKSSADTRLVIAGAMSQFGSAEIWKRVISVIDDQPTTEARRTVVNAISRNGKTIRSRKMVQQFCDLMVACLNEKTDRDSMEYIAAAIVVLKEKRGAKFQATSVPKAARKAIRSQELWSKHY